jgi:hypothetical protein
MNGGGATTDAARSAAVEVLSIAGICFLSGGAFSCPWLTTHRSQARTTLALLLGAWLAIGLGESHAGASVARRPGEAWAVEAAFREAFQLWADERFETLWERGLLASRYRVSREMFVRGMRHRVVKPTCCWDQLRGVRGHLQGAEEAIVEAQVGVDVRTLGTTVVRSMLVYLRREEGVWRVALEDFLTKPEVGLPWGLGWPQ